MDSSRNDNRDHLHVVLSSMVRKLIAEVVRIQASREFLLEVSTAGKPPFEKEANNKRSLRPFRPRMKRKQLM